MAQQSGISWTDATKRAARSEVNKAVRRGDIPRPDDLPCKDCGHVHKAGAARHQYDHHRGYASANWLDVEAVCTPCHVLRDNKKKAQVACIKGHTFDDANTIVAKNGTRHCRECRRAYDRENRGRDAEFWRNYRQQRGESYRAMRRAHYHASKGAN